ncbi:glycosyl hydrolase family 95 catalytic domain-containing protein [Aquisphaera insulae]|uniref:glycosyl hydrolase family 95 catalytic domain-containing protein n=1 Tax=Aquisphaera insulae TaxID=2712864 RepID=UPI0013EC17F2|nr:glycoside hydrolase N-terminal domain-containing protein [Aquisphaera insulae]
MILILPASAAPPAPAPPDEPMSVWFNRPARSFHESAVVGNGRLGGMDFGGIGRERIVLNESSMWSGGPYDGNNYEAAKSLPEIRQRLFARDINRAQELIDRSLRYADGIKGWNDEDQFGTYQILADLILTTGAEEKVASPTGNDQGDGKTIEGSHDGDPGTKWCVQDPGRTVAWQADLASPREVRSYSLTSADDMPERDPRDWVLEGSNDGKAWTLLDHRTLDAPFAKRFEARTFEIAHPGAYRSYRFTFTPTPGVSHFQVAEIALAGVTLGGDADAVAADDYRRDLNLMTGVVTTRYTRDGVTYTRELVASKPDEVIAIRLKASRPGALTFRAALSRGRNATVQASRHAQILEGQLPFHRPGGGGEGIRYCAVLGARADGGTVTARQEGLEVRGANEVVLVVSAGTNLLDDDHFAGRVISRLHALGKPFDALRDAAAADHRRYMERCQLTLPAGPNATLPTPERVKRNEEAPDPSLAAVYFQYGRYLMVAGSRPDSPLPTNLQGIWAEEYSPPWRGDFHTNINLQMNYWPAEVANLSDCHAPLFRFLEGMAREGAKTAKAYYGAPGWMAFHTQNPWFETAPSFAPACIGPTCGAWLVQHVWTHYEFSQDREFLRTYYPLMKGAAEFCLAALVEEPEHRWLVTAPSNSPENAYAYADGNGKTHHTALCVGSTYDMQIIRGLFAATAAAARVLGTDSDFAAKLDAAGARLAPTRVNSAGRIMEWLEDFEETEVHHRHCSHLWGLYPGTEISPNTPELYRGARLSLERRGDASTGWSMAWKANFWARLRDGDRAGKLLSMLIGRGAGNLMCLHPPFQIDGNFGGSAAVAEMLIQSHDGTITLLPALPAAWRDGRAAGLRARGDVTASFAWEDGKVTSYKLTSPTPHDVKLRVNGEVRTERAEAP